MTEKEEIIRLLKKYWADESYTLVSAYLIKNHLQYYTTIQYNIKDNYLTIINLLSDNTAS